VAHFDFHCVERIVFGAGRFEKAPELAAGLGRRAMVVTNIGPPGGGGPVDQLMDHLRQAGLAWPVVLQDGEPTVEQVDSAVATARKEGCDGLIGLGGGSAIDTAKAVAGLLTNGGGALDYMEVIGAGRQLAQPAAPWMAIPTTAGTGAEATRNAVIGYPLRRFKASIRSVNLLARVVLVDPVLQAGAPAEVLARANADALCQLVESYTSRGAGPITDALALEGLRRAAAALGRAHTQPPDLAARSDMALAALLSGLALSSAGLGAAHGFAAAIGANFPAPHGAVCGALLPHVAAANVAALRRADAGHPYLLRYAQVGRILSGQPDLPDDQAADQAIAATTRFIASLAIPPLRQFGLGARHVDELVTLAQRTSSMKYNPVELPSQVLAGVLSSAI